MKRLLALLLVFATLTALISGCASEKDSTYVPTGDAISALGLFAIRTSRVSRSSFYCIGGCTAAGILLIQASLNCLGTVDILPFTGKGC